MALRLTLRAFDKAMAHQKEQARASGKFKMAANLEYDGPATVFHGYDLLESKSNVLALYKDGVPVNMLNEGEIGVAVLDDTPFYAESGGQVGDCGELRSVHGIFAVEEYAEDPGHGVRPPRRGEDRQADVARCHREGGCCGAQPHDTQPLATHLMHKALREVLGGHVQQKGSQVDADKTRFDFVHTQPLSDAEIRKVESIVNAEILANAECQARVMSIEDAQKTGAMMLFGENTATRCACWTSVRRASCAAVRMSSATGDIGLFKILAESGVAAGVRRVEAVTGEGALALVQQHEMQLAASGRCGEGAAQEAAARVAQILDNVKALEKELARLKSKLASAQAMISSIRRWTATASRCWPRNWRVPMPQGCARRSTSSRTSSNRPQLCWPQWPTARSA